MAAVVLLIRAFRGFAVAVLVLALSGCTGLFFQPSPVLVRTPDALGLRYQDVNFAAADDVPLHAWFLPADSPRGTVLFLHGNAENISTHIASVAWLPAAGFQVLLLDYRGYGRSGGKPTVDGAQLDIDAALAHLLARPDVDAGRIVLLGQSLGGALAVRYAGEGPRRGRLRAVVIDSAFASYRDIAREKLDAVWWLRWLRWPAGFTVDDDASPIRSVARIAPVPVLFLVGGQDGIVPAHHGRRLYEAAREPKAIWELPRARHIEALHLPEVQARLRDYLAAAVAR